MSLFNTHLLTDEERELLYRAGRIAAELWDWKNPTLIRDHYMYNFTKAEMKTLEDIHRKIEERPFYYVHRHGDMATIFKKDEKGSNPLISFPRPEDNENTSDILTSEGVTEFVCYLDSRDLMCHALFGAIMGLYSNLWRPPLFTFSSDAYNSFFIGKENLTNRIEENEYGSTKEETRKVIRILSEDGKSILLPASSFEESLFVNPPLHKLFAQITGEIRKSNTVPLDLDEYMELRELTNKHEARAQIAKLLNILLDMKFLFNNRHGNVLDYWEPIRGKDLYEICFTDSFVDHINSRDAHLFAQPRELFALRNSLTYWIGAYANLHRQRNKKNPNRDIINIGTMSKRTYLPTDTHRKSEKQVKVDPLWRAFDELFERRILYPQLVYPRTGEFVRDTSEDWIRAREDFTFLSKLNIRVSWLCNVPNYDAKS